jgi:D-arabinose 1-dehydrogenase-like Zn-dependent alcohol dehydrogenase
MKAMLLRQISSFSENPNPLELAEIPKPVPGFGEVLKEVSTCGVCHSEKEFLSNLVYSEHLWNEKEIKTVANVTREDVSKFLEIASKISLKPEIYEYLLEKANLALLEIKQQKIRGAKVLRIR